MTAPVGAEGAAPAVDAAVRRPLGDISASASADRFTQARFERITALVVALGCAVLGTQSFLNAVGSTQESSSWHTALVLAAFAPLAVMLMALASGVAWRAASRVCAVALVVVFACWPFATAAVHTESPTPPWIWYLLNVATAAAVMAFRMPLQVVWAVLVPVLYGVGRVLQVGPDYAQVTDTTLDVAFAMILAAVIIVLGWMLRAAAVGIDNARREAVASYAAAAEAAAAEAERVAVAALMHDSVLAALIAAERATTPREEGLAVGMAREALTRLANAEQDAGEGSDEPVDVTAVVTGIRRAGAELGLTLPISADVSPDAAPIPGRVARALILATTQAMANGVQHAGGAGLSVDVRADATDVIVRISDAGGGFDPDAVPADRLGIRGSIVARMAASGGRARVQTGASGTTVHLAWERTR